MRKSQLFSLPQGDLEHIVRLAAADLEALRGKRIFITGGTGFFGKWILGGLVFANAELGLGVRITVLSRRPAAFAQSHPDVDEIPKVSFLAGDVASLPTKDRTFDFILHAATDTIAITSEAGERERTRAIVRGTRNILELAQHGGARLLNVSSGGVYGTAAAKPEGAGEQDATEPVTEYGRAKLAAEKLGGTSGADFVTARAFAFLGPHLPLDAHYAAGNFLRDARAGGPILVRGDGTARRSYLYPADLVVWLLGVLVRGRCGAAYNVGSDEAVTTAELARFVAQSVEPHPDVIIQAVQAPGPQNSYLPNIARAREELGLQVTISLREAIARTLHFLEDWV